MAKCLHQVLFWLSFFTWPQFQACVCNKRKHFLIMSKFIKIISYKYCAIFKCCLPIRYKCLGIADITPSHFTIEQCWLSKEIKLIIPMKFDFFLHFHVKFIVTNCGNDQKKNQNNNGKTRNKCYGRQKNNNQCKIAIQICVNE